ncbi:MAG: hypothetical protein ACUVRG_10445, partial [Ignavibacterium sp.]|uniref:hypothetical protein n=1 Tax=Ignavibacterium sp. TaxID=2651167 RepID=UPI00404AC86C
MQKICYKITINGVIYQSSVLVYNETSEKFSVVQNKPFAPVSATNYLKDNDIVLVMKIVSEIRIY